MHKFVYAKLGQADAGDNEVKLMTKLAPEWIRTSDPVIRSRARYRWTMVTALFNTQRGIEICHLFELISGSREIHSPLAVNEMTPCDKGRFSQNKLN